MSVRRIMGTETEYAVSGAPGGNPVQWSFDVVAGAVRQGRDVPVGLALVHAAVDEECDSARATLAEVNLEQWVRTNGFDARRITDLRALTAHAADEAEGTYGMEQA